MIATDLSTLVNDLQIIQARAADLEQENERLRTENEYLTQTMDGWVERRDEVIKDLEDSLKAALEAKPEPAKQSEAITKLLELIRPDVERLELIKTEDPRLLQIPGVFREINQSIEGGGQP